MLRMAIDENINRRGRKGEEFLRGCRFDGECVENLSKEGIECRDR